MRPFKATTGVLSARDDHLFIAAGFLVTVVRGILFICCVKNYSRHNLALCAGLDVV
jgi:hypothetical protein